MHFIVKKICFIAIVLLIPVLCFSADYYVRTDGNNGNDGSADDAAHAWSTVTYAESQAVAGDTIHIAAGTYDESVTINIKGTAENRITFVGTGDVYITAFIFTDADYITLDNLIVGSPTGNSYMITLDANSDNNIFTGCTFDPQGSAPITGWGKAGIYLGGDNNTVTDCIFQNFLYASCAYIGYYDASNSNTITLSEFKNNVDQDILRGWGSDHVFSYNNIHDNTFSEGCIDIYSGYTITAGADQGTGYSVNDIITIVQTDASGGQIKVTSVGGSGEVTGSSWLHPGQGYSVANDLTTTVSPAGGSSCLVNITKVVDNPNHADFFQTFSINNTTTFKDVLFEGNVITDSKVQAFYFSNSDSSPNISNITFRNNIWDNVHSAGQAVNGVLVNFYNNTFYKVGYGSATSSHPVMMVLGEGEVINNVFLECGPDASSTSQGWYQGASLTANNNYVGGTSYATKTITETGVVNGGDPKFTNVAGSDFTISAADSPLVDVGATIASFADDYANNSRPQGSGWDIGAYEYIQNQSCGTVLLLP